MERRIPAKVRNGVIVLEDVAIAEGASVTVVVDEESLRPPGGIRLDADGMPVLTPEQEAELEEAFAEGDRGEGIPWAVVLDELRRKHP